MQRFVKKYQINEALIPRGPTNQELADRARKDGVDLADTDAGQRLKDQMFIENFLAKWRYMGVILTDMDVSSRYQKLFNLNVRGRSRVFNLWNTRMNGKYERKMARDRVQGHYSLPFAGSSRRHNPCNRTGQRWQLFHKRTTRTVSGRFGRAHDARKTPLRPRLNGGLYREPRLNIEVGRVLNALSKKPEEHFQRRAFREHKQMGHLPMVEVALHTGQL